MKNRKGFTIVELVIVIAVIAILAAVLIPTFSGVISKANSSAALQEATSAMKATLAMSKNGVISENTLFIIGDSNKAKYFFEFKNEAIKELGDQPTAVPSKGGVSVAKADSANKYDRIIIAQSIVANTGAFDEIEGAKAVAIIKDMFSASAVVLQNCVADANGVRTNISDSAAAYELKVTVGETVTYLSVYTSSDYPKDIVTFVPVTIAD